MKKLTFLFAILSATPAYATKEKLLNELKSIGIQTVRNSLPQKKLDSRSLLFGAFIGHTCTSVLYAASAAYEKLSPQTGKTKWKFFGRTFLNTFLHYFSFKLIKRGKAA